MVWNHQATKRTLSILLIASHLYIPYIVWQSSELHNFGSFSLSVARWYEACIGRTLKVVASRLNERATPQGMVSCARTYQTSDYGEHKGHLARCRGQVYEKCMLLSYNVCLCVCFVRLSVEQCPLNIELSPCYSVLGLCLLITCVLSALAARGNFWAVCAFLRVTTIPCFNSHFFTLVVKQCPKKHCLFGEDRGIIHIFFCLLCAIFFYHNGISIINFWNKTGYEWCSLYVDTVSMGSIRKLLLLLINYYKWVWQCSVKTLFLKVRTVLELLYWIGDFILLKKTVMGILNCDIATPKSYHSIVFASNPRLCVWMRVTQTKGEAGQVDGHEKLWHATKIWSSW